MKTTSRREFRQAHGNKMMRYSVLIENGMHEGEEGKALRAELEQVLGTNDPDLLTADMRIKQLVVLRRLRGKEVAGDKT